MKRLLNRLVGWWLYRLDRNFRRLVDSKQRGPNDAVGMSESIVMVMRRKKT